MKNASELPGKGKTGVSLHCHTEHSKEMLDFLPHYAEKLPIIAQFWRRERKNYIKREGRGIDFSTAHWSPPLSAKDVYDIEKRQINDAGLDAIISLTDHDSIEANLIVNEAAPEESAPISMEWTVPYEYGFFHVGVHNLPKDRAIDITKTLLDFTFVEENQTNERLTELLDMLWEMPGVLVVLNHPLWDIELVGQERHEELLRNFIRTHGRWIHAFEINGFRSWSENKAVIEMAESLGIPIATGGDRHGCKPNTVINLTNADTFEGFVDEIRNEKRSEVVLMPEYKHPLHWRQMQSFSEILKFYPEFREGRKKWFDRVHFDIGDGHGVRPLSVHWERGGPAWLRVAIWTLGVLGGPRMRPIFRGVREKADRVPRDVSKAEFDIRPMDEIIPELSTGSPA